MLDKHDEKMRNSTVIDSENQDKNGALLLSALPSNIHEYNFYQLVELLHNIKDQDPDSGDWEAHYRLLFRGNSSLGFAASDVTALYQVDEERLGLDTTFFGLNGAQSPLPSFLLEQIATEDEQGVRKAFLDFFNHRLICLLYRIWRKYRYYVRFHEQATDKFSAQLFALVGLADERLRGETPINWCKMLSYSGMLAGRSRSPQVVSGIISHYFDIEDVTIKLWERRIIAIPQEQKIQLGMQNSSLGEDTVIGDSCADCMGKFVICLTGLDQTRFKDFLPSGKEYQPLMTLVEFILREQMAFDLELVIKEGETSPMQLSATNSASLGWYSFIGNGSETRANGSQTRRIRIQIRQ